MNKPISFIDKMNASVLMLITPERSMIKKEIAGLGGRLPKSSGIKHIKPEFMELNGIKVRYAKGGNPDGPTLLMLSPLPQSIVAFDQIWPLLESKYKLVALDLPGFGHSEGGMDYMTFKAQGEFIEAFVKHTGIKNPHVIGPDVGLPAAMYYAIHCDNDIASLIIGDGPAILDTQVGSVISKMINSAFFRTLFPLVGSGAFLEAADLLCWLRHTPSDEEMSDYVESYRGRLQPIMRWFKTYPENLKTIDPALENLDIPTKIFWGESDVLLDKSDAEKINKRMKRTDMTIFKDCGHFSYQDQSDKFAKMLTDWVDSGHQAV